MPSDLHIFQVSLNFRNYMFWCFYPLFELVWKSMNSKVTRGKKGQEIVLICFPKKSNWKYIFRCALCPSYSQCLICLHSLDFLVNITNARVPIVAVANTGFVIFSSWFIKSARKKQLLFIVSDLPILNLQLQTNSVPEHCTKYRNQLIVEQW